MNAPLDIATRRRRLHFRCWHRGTKELDLMLGRFADAELDTLDEAEVGQLEALLFVQDLDLYAWLMRQAPPPPEHDHALLQRIIRFNDVPRPA